MPSSDRFLSSPAWVRALGAVGRFMITTGVVLLLLVAYQLWGTNLQTNRAQDQLRSEFEARLARAAATVEATTTAPSTLPGDGTEPTPTSPVTGPPRTTPPEVAAATGPIDEGTPLGRISIPSIGLSDFYIVQGTTVAQLKRGAGHYSESPLPGQKGNAAVAGHRTTYGAPFHNIDRVVSGDLVMVETFQGRFRYEVTEQRIVSPSDVSVLEDRGDNRLTLTACHPKFSAKQRIIVFAELVGNPVPKLPGQVLPRRRPRQPRRTARGPGRASRSSRSATGSRSTPSPANRSSASRAPGGAWRAWRCGCSCAWPPGRVAARTAIPGSSPTSSAPRCACCCSSCSSRASATKH
ncbi:MAG: class E sortase [Acidimicrobiales bacterium]